MSAHVCVKKGICDPSIHKIRYTRLPPLKKLALISKTNENLKLLNPCNGNLHNNYYIAKTVGEDSKTNPCQLNKYNSAYSKNSCGFFLIESGLHILSHYSITMAVHKCLEGCPWSLLQRFSIALKLSLVTQRTDLKRMLNIDASKGQDILIFSP